MLFLAGIIAICTLQAWGTADRLHSDDWFESWRELLAGLGLSGGFGLLLLVALPALLVAVVLHLLEPVLFGLVWILLAAALLLYAFGRGDFQAVMGRYRGHAFSGDFEAAYLDAVQSFGWDDSDPQPRSAVHAHALIQRALLYEGYQRWFAVLFYFAVLGPAGAVAYRLLQMAGGSFDARLQRRWMFYADWIPARLLAVAFSVTGDFIGSRTALISGIKNSGLAVPDLLHAVAGDALGGDTSLPAADDPDFGPAAATQNRELGNLLSRSAMCWVVVFSVVVLVS